MKKRSNVSRAPLRPKRAGRKGQLSARRRQKLGCAAVQVNRTYKNVKKTQSARRARPHTAGRHGPCVDWPDGITCTVPGCDFPDGCSRKHPRSGQRAPVRENSDTRRGQRAHKDLNSKKDACRG